MVRSLVIAASILNWSGCTDVHANDTIHEVQTNIAAAASTTISTGLVGAFALHGTLSAGPWFSEPPDVYRWQLWAGDTVVIPVTGPRLGDTLSGIEVRGSSNADGAMTVTRQNYDSAIEQDCIMSGGFSSTGSQFCRFVDPPTILGGEVMFVRITAGDWPIDFTTIETIIQ